MIYDNNTESLLSTFYRYLKQSRLFVFLDVLVSALILFIILLLFVALAKADNITWDGSQGTVPSTFHPILTTRAALLPSVSSPNGNTVTVTAQLNAFAIGGYAILNGTGEIQVHSNVLRIEGQLSRITLVGTPSAGTAFVRNGTSISLSVARAENNILHLINVYNEAFQFFGGHVEIYQGNATGIASGNTVWIIDSEMDPDLNVPENAGGAVFINNNFVTAIDAIGIANYNTVYFINSKAQRLYGGEVLFYDLNSTYQKAETSYNTVYVRDSEIAYNLYGGYIAVWFPDVATAIHNTVTLEGNVSIGRHVMGGRDAQDTAGEYFTGNTLNIVNPVSGGIKVTDLVRSFETYNFVFAADSPNGAVALESSGVFLNNAMSYQETGTRASHIGTIDISPGETALEVGHTLVLFKTGAYDAGNNKGIVSDAFTQTEAAGSQGTHLFYEYSLTLDKNSNSNTLLATVTKSYTHPQLESFQESMESGLIFINLGADLISEYGMDLLLNPKQSSTSDLIDPCPRPTVTIERSRISRNVRGRLDVEGTSAILGIGCKRTHPTLGTFVFGIFAEGGKGDYESQKTVATLPSIRATGDLDYLGGGILARLEFPGSEFGHFYVETAFHTGKLKTTYQTLEFQPVVGQVTRFNFHSRYWGTLLGTGYIFNIAPNRAFEAYAKLFWTRIAGDTLKTNLNESLTLEPTNSLRLQVGLKYAHAVLPNISYFVGGAFEGEMKGTVKSHSYGRPITPISLKGGNAIVEAGLNLKPSANSPLSFGIASRGYFGRRKGIAGILHLSYSF